MALTVTGSSGSILRILSTINKLQAEQADTQTRLSTGSRINKASDDPAGLIALNSVNAQLAAVTAALDGNRRSESMLNVADGALTEVGSLVSEIQSLALQAADPTVTASEKAAYQAQIDSSLDSIDRLINDAQFNGQKLFNGTNRINAYSDSTASVKDIRVYNRDPRISAAVSLNISVTAAATRASSVTTINAAAATTLSAETVLQVTGKLGTATITMANGATGTQVLSAIRAQTAVTGVSAALQGTNLAFMSNTKGSDAFVQVSTISGDVDYVTKGQIQKTSGVDAKATVNGQAANAQGTEVFYNGNGISLSFNLAKDTVTTHVLTVTGGGATFQLGAGSSTKTALGLGNVNTVELGRSDLGYLSNLRSGGSASLTNNLTSAQQIANYASNQVATAAARVGSFNKYQVGASIRMLETTRASLSDTADLIGGADYATDTALLQQQDLLMSAAVSVLSAANSQRTNVLALLLQ